MEQRTSGSGVSQMDNNTYDFEYGARMDWLCQLMLCDKEDRPMIELQKEALEMYPLNSKVLKERWLSKEIALKAGDILAEKYFSTFEW